MRIPHRPPVWPSHAAALHLWPSCAGETAALLFCEVLVGDFGLEFLSEVLLLEARVLVFELLHADHHGGIHAAKLGPPLLKACGADSQLTAYLRHRQTGFNTFEGSHVLAVGKT